MSQIISDYFSSYMGTQDGFDKFHTEVLNMPRPNFSQLELKYIRSIAAYLLLLDNVIADEEVYYKQIFQSLSDLIKQGVFPEQYRNSGFEEEYFVNQEYDDQVGRLFRHIMELAQLFNLMDSGPNGQKNVINYSVCKEFVRASDDVLMPVARNYFLTLDVGRNSHFARLKGVEITKDTHYCPTRAVLKYIEAIGRPATKFELAILLGRLDALKDEQSILDRAINIGNIFPVLLSEQIEFFFSAMNWQTSEGYRFNYVSSQEPWFKFRSYLLFMESFELLSKNENTELYSLTTYAVDLLSDEISPVLADLERLLNRLDERDVNDAELSAIIIEQRNRELVELVKNNKQFVVKINRRAVNSQKYSSNGKRIRNKLVAELAKIQADYTCQATKRKSFRMPSGHPYCEAHHIIQFAKSGPDITDNLIVLGPEPHMLIHHARAIDRDDLYRQLISTGAISMERFERMAVEYHCLTKDHIEILHNDKIISTLQKDHLFELIGSPDAMEVVAL